MERHPHEDSDHRARTRNAVFGLGLILILVSVGQTLKFLGPAGLAGFAIAVFAILALGFHRAPRFLQRVTEKQALVLAAITFLLLLVGFALLYPIADAGLVGKGSDREDQLNIATRAFLQGKNPFANQGYYLPGTYLLAAPFVLLGNSAWQNLPWLAVFFLASRKILGDARLALLLLWTLIGLSPALLQELVTGGDLIANTISVIVLALLMAGTVGRPDAVTWKKVLASVFFGVAVASRLNFLLVVPLVFSLLVNRVGWRTALRYTLVTGATVAALSVPYYLYDPQSFAVLRYQNRFGLFRRLLPYAPILVPALAASIAALLSWPRFTKTTAGLLRNATIVLAAPVLAGILLAVIRRGVSGLMFAVQGWALFFLFSGALYLWGRLFGTDPNADLTL